MKLSKSKLALAKVINENGGWLIFGDFNFVTSSRDGAVKFFHQMPRRDGDNWVGGSRWLYWVDSDDQLPNWHQCVLSRGEYYHAYPKADADEWIEWQSPFFGEMPVCENEVVDIRIGDDIHTGFVAKNWKMWGVVTHYRLHKPEVKPEFCESVTRSIPEPAEKPTIEQLAQDYRNKLDYANRKQKEADDAKAAADAALVELVAAGKAIDLVIDIAKPNPDLAITDWRDLKVGDVIWVGGTKAVGDEPEGECTIIDEYIEEYLAGLRMFLQPFKVRRGDAEFRPDLLCRGWEFIRRP